MLKLVVPPSLKQDFATIEALWHSAGETRRVDSLVLSWVKYEKQLRRLFCFLVFQHPNITEGNISTVIDVFAQNRSLNPETFIHAIKALGVTSVPDLIGPRHAELAKEISRIKQHRNKLIHGLITGHNVQSIQLERDVKWIIDWVVSLAHGADAAFGYDGLKRNTFRAAKAATGIAVQDFPFSTSAEFSSWLKKVVKGGTFA